MSDGRAVLRQPVAQRAQRVQVVVVIDVLKEQDVRGDGRDHRDDGGDLRVVIAQDIAEQKAGAPAFQFDIPGGEAQAVGDGGGAKAEQREAERDQARCSPLGPRSSAA